MIIFALCDEKDWDVIQYLFLSCVHSLLRITVFLQYARTRAQTHKERQKDIMKALSDSLDGGG